MDEKKKKYVYFISTHEPYKAWAIKKMFDNLGIWYAKRMKERFYEDGYGSFEIKYYWKFGTYVNKEQEYEIRKIAKKLDYPMSDEYVNLTKDFGYEKLFSEFWGY